MEQAHEQARDDPAEPPRIRKGLLFHRTQAWGVPLIVLVPVLAVLGVFGRTDAEVVRVEGDLEVAVRHPARMRYKQIAPVVVVVENRSASVIDAVLVRFDVAYLDGFSSVSFTPTPPVAYELPVPDLEPGEPRLVSGQVQGERYGVQEGRVVVEREDGTRIEVPIRTFVFP